MSRVRAGCVTPQRTITANLVETHCADSPLRHSAGGEADTGCSKTKLGSIRANGYLHHGSN